MTESPVVKRFYLYGGSSQTPCSSDPTSMICLAKELRLMFKGAEIYVVKYSVYDRDVYNVDDILVENHIITFDISTVVIAHSYGCLVAKYDIYAGDEKFLFPQVFSFIQLSPFCIQSYLEHNHNISQKEMEQWRYFEDLPSYSLPIYRPDTQVIYAEHEYPYNIDGIGFLNVNKAQLHKIKEAYHGLNLNQPDSSVFQDVLHTIYKIINQ